MVIDGIEETFYVTLDYPGNTSPVLNFSKGGMTAPTEAEPMGGIKKGWFQNGFHDHEHSLLDDFFTRGSYPQRTKLSIRFGDVHPAIRRELELFGAKRTSSRFESFV
jgi:hypothetical protein